MNGSLRKVLSIFAAITAILQMTGCATRQVALQYNSSMTPPHVSGSPTVYISGFTDMRAEKSLGYVRNGYGMKLANVEASPGEPPVTVWIAYALAQELRQAGCSVTLDNPGKTVPQFVIDGSLQRVCVDSYLMLQGDISVNICIKSGGQSVFNQLYHAEASRINWWASSKEFQQTLDLTLQNLMEKAVPDIVAALSTPPTKISSVITPVSSLPAEPVVTPVAAAPAPVTNAAVIPPSSAQPVVANTPKTTVDTATQLKKLKELKDLGLLTDEEYESKRKELVGEL